MLNSKMCNKCKEVKTLDQFHVLNRSRDGRQTRCKVCACEAANADRQRNLEARRKTSRDYARSHKDKARKRMERWYAKPENKQKMINRAAAYKKANKEKLKQQYVTRTTQYSPEELATITKNCSYCSRDLPLNQFAKGASKFGRASFCTPCMVEKQRQKNKQNPEAAKARNKKHYQDNKEYYRERSKVYRQQNWERIKQVQNKWRRDTGKNTEYRQKRRSIKRAAFVAPVNWKQLKKAFNNCCAYCGDPSQSLTMDHVIPLSRGGTHEPKNVVPACLSCNSRKYTYTLEELGWVVRNP